MGKTRTLAGTVSTGGPLEGGTTLVSGTAITTNGQASYEFTGIPSWAKNIRLLFRNVSPDDSNGVISVQLGTASGYVTSGYSLTGHSFSSASVNPFTATTSFPVWTSGAGPYMFTGIMDLSEIASNVWVESGQLKASGTISLISSGDISLGAELTKIQIAVSAGLFDGGTINILYE